MTTATAPIQDKGDGLRQRLILLIGQSFFLGLTLGLLVVAGISLLLSIYGSKALPYVYIVVAVLGAVLFYSFAEVQRRWTLIQVSTITEALIILFLILAWAGLAFAQMEWLAFASVVAFSLIIQVGFVILGGQAGRLLDVRQIKRYFPRIVAGFVVGFMVAGAIVNPLQRLLGPPEYLLLASAVSAAFMLGLLLLTNTRYQQALKQVDDSGPQVSPPPLRQILFKRFVLFIFLYQMLSAMASQLLDFMVMDTAGARFTDGEALAQFFGTYTFFLNLTDLLFVALVAGLLLSRFGLRFGLAANPGLDILILIAIVVVGLAAGPEAVMFFWLVVAARVLDIALTDGTTRSSINAAYQALPGRERVAVLTSVEGIGVPLALGLTGVVLLIYFAIDGLTVVHVAIFTLAVSLLWIASGLFMYREYAENLLQTLRRRTLEPAELTLEDSSSLGVIDHLLESDRLSDVRLGLDMLAGAEHPSLPNHLIVLAASDKPDIQVEALVRIEARREMEALPQVQTLATTSEAPVVKGAALRALCALDTDNIQGKAVPYLNDANPAVREGAVVGILRYGGVAGQRVMSDRLVAWANSSEPAVRIYLAQILGDAGLPDLYLYLLPLLSDPDPQVRVVALCAAAHLKHPELLPPIMAGLDDMSTRSAAMEALVAYGDAVLPIVEKALSADMVLPIDNTLRLLRVCSQIKGESVTTLLYSHLDHPSCAVQDQILAVLGANEFQAVQNELPVLTGALRREAGQAYQLLVIRQDIEEEAATEPLRRSLDDEIDRARRRVFWLLSFMYEARPVVRAELQLTTGSGSEKALALEMLDVNLSSEHKNLAFPLIDPRLDHDQRILALAKQIDPLSLPDELGRNRRLLALIEGGDGVWTEPWTQACAIYAATKLEVREAILAIEAALDNADPSVRETAIWSLSTLSPERFNLHYDRLSDDSDPLVAQQVAFLRQAKAQESKM